ncbi:MAG: hypothetical protein AABX84_02125, partial [Nanoarchaeota archaeon]
AAIIIGVSSLLIFGYSQIGKLTGNVIGNNLINNSASKIILILLVLFSMILFFIGKRNLKKIKAERFKRKI